MKDLETLTTMVFEEMLSELIKIKSKQKRYEPAIGPGLCSIFAHSARLLLFQGKITREEHKCLITQSVGLPSVFIDHPSVIKFRPNDAIPGWGYWWDYTDIDIRIEFMEKVLNHIKGVELENAISKFLKAVKIRIVELYLLTMMGFIAILDFITDCLFFQGNRFAIITGLIVYFAFFILLLTLKLL